MLRDALASVSWASVPVRPRPRICNLGKGACIRCCYRDSRSLKRLFTLQSLQIATVYEKLGVDNCRVLQEQYTLHLFPRESFVGTGLVQKRDHSIQGHQLENALRHLFRVPLLCHTDDEAARDRSRQILSLGMRVDFFFTGECPAARCNNDGFLASA